MNSCGFRTALEILEGFKDRIQQDPNISLKRKASKIQSLRELQAVIRENYHTAMMAGAIRQLQSADDLENERFANHNPNYDADESYDDAGDVR